MSLEASIAQENEIREQLNELNQEIQEVRERLREAKDSGDAVAFTDANEELEGLQEERSRLRTAFRLAGEERLRATQAEAKATVAREIEETRAKLASVFNGALPGIEELQTAITAFDSEAFKKAAAERIREAGLLVAKLRARQVAYRSPWNPGTVEDLINRINLTQALLNAFTGGSR